MIKEIKKLTEAILEAEKVCRSDTSPKLKDQLLTNHCDDTVSPLMEGLGLEVTYDQPEPENVYSYVVYVATIKELRKELELIISPYPEWALERAEEDE